MTEPPNAKTWRAIRELCAKHPFGDCAFPFCRCLEREEQETPERKAVA